MAPTRMTLAGVLEGVRLRGVLDRQWAEMTVEGLEYDSRKVEKDTLFFAFAGARVDGRQFAREAVARGACAVVSELPAAEDRRQPRQGGVDRRRERPKCATPITGNAT